MSDESGDAADASKAYAAQEIIAAASLDGPAPAVARRLLGALLLDTSGPIPVVGRIVETEAYQQDDEASHSFRGPTPRTQAMFGPPGLAYVYRSYGLHWCINVSCGKEGVGAAVLLRALEPLAGLAVMRSRRAPAAPTTLQLCRGPGNLARALAITVRDNGLSLLDPAGRLRLLTGPQVRAEAVRRGPRIGISRAQDKLWRFYLAQNPFVSATRAGGVPLRGPTPTASQSA